MPDGDLLEHMRVTLAALRGMAEFYRQMAADPAAMTSGFEIIRTSGIQSGFEQAAELMETMLLPFVTGTGVGEPRSAARSAVRALAGAHDPSHQSGWPPPGWPPE